MRALTVAIVLVTGLVAGLVALARPASAETPTEITPPALVPPVLDPPESPPPRELPEPAKQRYAYRYQIAITDASAIAMSVIIDQISKDGGGRPGGLATLTIASYFFTAPMIHGIHRQGKRALASFGMRAGLPLLLGLLGEKIDDPPECMQCNDTLRSDGKIAGITIGVLIAMAVDTALLTRPIYVRGRRPVPTTAWTPSVSGVRGGATAGVVGTF